MDRLKKNRTIEIYTYDFIQKIKNIIINHNASNTLKTSLLTSPLNFSLSLIAFWNRMKSNSSWNNSRASFLWVSSYPFNLSKNSSSSGLILIVFANSFSLCFFSCSLFLFKISSEVSILLMLKELTMSVGLYMGELSTSFYTFLMVSCSSKKSKARFLSLSLLR